MKNNYPFFRYITGDSKVHKMNSKMKILWFLISLLILVLLRDIISTAIFTLIILFMMLSSKINVMAYLLNLLRVWLLYVVGFVVTYLLTLNAPIALFVGYKLLLLVLILLIITFTTSLSEIAWGFECLFSKLKKIGAPVSRISLKIALQIKFIATLFEQYKTIRKSMMYRGMPYKGSKAKVFVPALNLSYRASRQMESAMKLRFYGKSKRRTNYHENKETSFDKTLVFVCTIFIYVVIWLGWM